MSSKLQLLLAVLFLFGCDVAPPPVATQPLESETYAPVVPEGAIAATVTRIIDGDTIAIVQDGKEQVTRIDGIDCPETRGSGGQPFGDEAEEFVSAWCLGKEVQIVQTGRHYDRWVAYVYRSSDGEFLNYALLRAGLAWHSEEYEQSEEQEKLEL